MKEWWSISDLLELKHRALPTSRRGLLDHAAERQWDHSVGHFRDRDAQGGGREYHYKLFPVDLRAEITFRAANEAASVEAAQAEDARRDALWAIYSHASPKAKADAGARLALVRAVDDLMCAGSIAMAVGIVARKSGASSRTIYRHLDMIAGVAKADWLAALTPRHVGSLAVSDCDPRAWDMLVSDYLRPSSAAFKPCFDRMMEAAAAHGWSPIPSAKTLQRRIAKEIPAATLILARQGKGAVERLFPALRRTRDHLWAMHSVNADGHLLDIAVKWEDGTIGRAIIIGFQDLYSGMLVSHRLTRTENSEAIRLAIADMFESWGIPQHAYFDNGRAFMSKMLTGHMKHRYRFAVKSEDPVGVLTSVGVEVHAVRPYHGQSKPVERAWGEIAERVSRHPKMDGAYLGPNTSAKPENHGDRAIPIAELRAFVAAEIHRHNMRDGRTAAVANGRSLWETFRSSYEAPTTLVKRATEAQRQFFLLAGIGISARALNGEIHMDGNRYWNPQMVDYRGRKVMVRFDPDNLHDDIHVYTLSGEPICRAECIDAAGFDTAEAAREQGRKVRKYMRLQREMLDLHRQLTPAQVADLIPDLPDHPTASPGVVQMVRGNTIRKIAPDSASDADAFMRGVAMASGEVVTFPTEKGDRP